MSGSERPVRIGMLTPSSSTVVEPYTSALLAPLFPRVTVPIHVWRYRRRMNDVRDDMIM
ncbi:hypothetical protein [Rhizobium sp. SL86]|uniref:hypothetical protein n=1 Tax=Rhizobium sp. SL86 TaxID=2995148 RepID=UPI002274FAE1|nr:hypothetical protein [Rhizobium sp. SL86]MCY1667781.1 hypothetical protein [Rhizobium sp. SL86]